MLQLSLILLVFTLGLRHGLDADHLAFIDGQTRYNWRMGSPLARWVGTLFSFGHGSVVAGIAAIIGLLAHNFKIPALFAEFGTWVSVLSLFAIGSINILNLIRTTTASSEHFQLRGLKGRFVPKIARETTNPLVIIVVGGLFALAADTVSQTSMWAMAAGSGGKYLPVLLGLVFMIGMMITDTIDSLVAYRLVSHTSRIGQNASRLIGWVIVILAYGVSIYEILIFFAPNMEINFEAVGIAAFALLVACYLLIRFKVRKQIA